MRKKNYLLIIILLVAVKILTICNVLFAQNNKVELENLTLILNSQTINQGGKISSPQFCPYDPNLISFVVITRGSRKLFIYNISDKKIFEIKSIPPGISENLRNLIPLESYNDELHWRPTEDKSGKKWFTFVGSGIGNNHDIYINFYSEEEHPGGVPIRLTSGQEVDNVPKWSPDGNKIVFVSGKTGGGDLYLIDVDKIFKSGKVKEDEYVRLTDNEYADSFPSWDPSGTWIAYSEYDDDLEIGVPIRNYGIAVIDMKQKKFPGKRERITADNHMFAESRPSWSYNSTRIAYYVSDTLGTNKAYIEVRDFDPYFKSFPKLITGPTLYMTPLVLSSNNGPAWGTNSKSIIYVAGDPLRYNPLQLTFIDLWKRYPEYSFVIPTGKNQNSNVSVYYEKNKFPQIIFMTEEGIISYIYKAVLKGDYLQMSTEDIPDPSIKNRESIYSYPWLTWKKVMTFGIITVASTIYAIIGRNGDNREPIPDPPSPPNP